VSVNVFDPVTGHKIWADFTGGEGGGGDTPVLEGIRYVRKDAKLLITVFVKSGLFVIGPSWVVFTVLGNREFPVHWFGIDQQRGAMLGMSLLLMEVHRAMRRALQSKNGTLPMSLAMAAGSSACFFSGTPP